MVKDALNSNTDVSTFFKEKRTLNAFVEYVFPLYEQINELTLGLSNS